MKRVINELTILQLMNVNAMFVFLMLVIKVFVRDVIILVIPVVPIITIIA